MANGKRILRLTAILIALAGVLGFQLEAMGMLGSAAQDAKGQPDVIMIDTIARLGELEQSAALFLHDTHTKALKKQGADCGTCHKTDADGTMSLQFMREEDQQDMNASEMKDLFHDGCIGCHTETAAKHLKTGPMAGECRSCHQDKPELVADRVEAGMDNLLHYAHWDSKIIPDDPGKETNCGACHTKSGEEDGWRFDPANAGKAMQTVYHSQCVTCHQSYIDKKADRSGPVQCAGCHGTQEVASRKAEAVKLLEAEGGKMPRLPRSQPDAVLMYDVKPGEPVKKLVAFDHKAHEAVADTCATCHVKGVNAPMDTSYKAMHDPAAQSSCVGCHVAEQAKPECAGCHAARSVVDQLSEASCAVCHIKTPEGEVVLTDDASKDARESLAAQLIAARPTAHAEVATKDIPEFVTIDSIAKEYKPSKLPHRKIVLKLMEGMKSDPLAVGFHTQPASMCAGCHHNSPVGSTPKCGSCHATPVGDMPSLKAAFHQQCMDCHTQMKLEKPAATNCVACHEKN